MIFLECGAAGLVLVGMCGAVAVVVQSAFFGNNGSAGDLDASPAMMTDA